MKFIYLVVLGISLFSMPSFGQKKIKLYSGKAPGSEKWDWKEEVTDPGYGRFIYNVVEPELWVYPAPEDKANGTGVIVAPGGAFHILAIDFEGIKVAEWLNARGITAFVLKYRVVRSATDNPMEELMTLVDDKPKLDSINAPVVEMATRDGIEAMRYVKSNLATYRLDGNKIGFMGFSAGGTLTQSVMLSAPQEFKPNFVAPIYLYGPAVIGSEMPKNTTPMFIAVASDDQLGFVPHSIDLYNRWFTAGHPVELHIYEKGGHGFGMHQTKTSSEHWILDFDNWLKMRGYL